jgi:hypothetical protein
MMQLSQPRSTQGMSRTCQCYAWYKTEVHGSTLNNRYWNIFVSQI